MTGHGTITIEQARVALERAAHLAGVVLDGPTAGTLADYITQTAEQAQTIRDQADENLRLQDRLERILELVEDGKVYCRQPAARAYGVELARIITAIGDEVRAVFANGKGDHAEP